MLKYVLTKILPHFVVADYKQIKVCNFPGIQIVIGITVTWMIMFIRSAALSNNLDF